MLVIFQRKTGNQIFVKLIQLVWSVFFSSTKLLSFRHLFISIINLLQRHMSTSKGEAHGNSNQQSKTKSQTAYKIVHVPGEGVDPGVGVGGYDGYQSLKSCQHREYFPKF